MQSIETEKAPAAIGTYSQAIRAGHTVYFSGQIGLDPQTMTLVSGGIDAEIVQVFENLREVCHAAGGHFGHIVKLNIYLTDLQYFSKVNEAMSRYFKEPYPARAVVEVAGLPRGALIEVDAVGLLT